MKDISELHFRVCDHGLFLPIARRLARDAGLVSYWTPHEMAFPSVKNFIGDGFPDIQRVESPWVELEEVDCFVFPDIGFPHLESALKAAGLPVWGAGYGERFEVSRSSFLRALAEAKLPIPPHHIVEGITQLKEYLHDKTDLWVKISRFRGDCETFQWRSAADDENRLNELSVKLGPFREQMLFFVFQPINTKNEDGVDTWCIDGAYPELVIHGMESKDKAYLGTWQKYADLPSELRSVNDAFAPLLARCDYRSFFSTEVRITPEGESYFIDPTCRAGSPPSQVMAEMIGNYAEIIWGGANGKLVEPEDAAKFGVQGLICVGGDRRDWRSLKVTDELDRWVKCPRAIWNDGRLWFPPDLDADGKDIGWLVGIGDRPEEAIRHLQHNSELLPDGATCEYSALADLIRQVNEAEASGMPFTDAPMPEPEIVIQES